MKKSIFRNKMLVMFAIIILIILAIGTSYAFYLASFNFKGSGNNIISTNGVVSATIDMQDKITIGGVYPGYKTVKKFNVKGEGKKGYLKTDVYLTVKPELGVFSDSVNWYVYKSKEEITCTSNIVDKNVAVYDDATCNIPDSASLVLEGSNSKKLLELSIDYDTNDTYYLVIEYLNINGDQSEQADGSFSIDVELGKDETKEIISKVNNSITFEMIEAQAGITVNSLGDGIYEINGTTTSMVNIRLSDYFRVSSPNGNYLYDNSAPNNKAIMSKGKTYQIKYEYISGSNTVDKYNSFRLCFSEPNSYTGLQTFAYDFHSGFVGTEKMLQDIGMYYIWISSGYTFENFKFKINIYETTSDFDEFGNINDIKTLNSSGTTFTAIWYDTGIVSVFGVNDMNVSEWNRQTTHINLTTHEMGTSLSVIYNASLASTPPYKANDNVKMTYQLISNSPDVDVTADYMSQIYFELMNTSSSPSTIKSPSISTENEDLSSKEVTVNGTLTKDIATPVLIIGKNVSIQHPWRFKFTTLKQNN